MLIVVASAELCDLVVRGGYTGTSGSLPNRSSGGSSLGFPSGAMPFVFPVLLRLPWVNAVVIFLLLLQLSDYYV